MHYVIFNFMIFSPPPLPTSRPPSVPGTDFFSGVLLQLSDLQQQMESLKQLEEDVKKHLTAYPRYSSKIL